MRLLFLMVLALPPGDSSASALRVDAVEIQSLQSAEQIRISSDVVFTSGSSLTLVGSEGYIRAASSVTAASFFGDGSHLLGVPSILGSTQVFSAAQTFRSSFTVESGGREIILSTSATTSGIRISSQGAVVFSPALHASSATIVAEYSTTGASLGPCISGSTLTIRTAGGKVEVIALVSVSISTRAEGPSCEAGISFLQDGQFVRDLSRTKGIVSVTSSPLLSAPRTVMMNYLVEAPSSGEHSYCLTLALVDTATACGGAPITIEVVPVAQNYFYVQELK